MATMSSFGLALFKHLSTTAEDVLISPLSLSACLAMVAAGATPDSTTEKELKLAGELPAVTTADMANSAWVRMNIKPEYVEDVKAKFQADAFTLDGLDPAPVNKWVSEKTKGLIKDLFSGPFDPLTVMVLVNTVFFKGSWAATFDPSRTENGAFQGFKSPTPCDMMFKKEKGIAYADTPAYKAVQLPYNDRATSMTIILPKERGPAGLDKLAQDFQWDLLCEALQPGDEVMLKMPRFKMTAGGKMKEALQAFGIKDAFQSKEGFLKMSDDPLVYLSEVMHKATVLVNEEGTVAAAATGAVMMTRCLPRFWEMTVDRPFLFVISGPENAIYFIGKVANPELAGVSATIGGY